jgi:phosphatidylglycerophosphate synthase
VRGRIVSAASGYHSVRAPTGHFLGVLKVAAADVPALAAAVAELAVLARHRPPAWEDVSAQRTERWSRRLATRARAAQGLEPRDPDDETFDDLAQLDAAADAELRRRVRALREDVVSLCLVGLVRTGVPVSNGYLRKFFWARPLDRAAASAAAFDLTTYDEDRLALDSAVKSSDGFFTTFLVSPYSRYIARWAARRGWTPNGITTLSMALGVVAAAAFAQGSRTGLVVGALMLQAAFTFDCVDGQLARYTRTFSALGAWLDSVFDRGKEYLVFAGLALGSTRGFDDDVWLLAVAAIVLQTVRHSVDFSYAAGQHHVIATVPMVPLAQGRDRFVATIDEPREPDAADPEGGGGLDDATEDPAPPPSEIRQSPAVWVGKRAVRLSRSAERSPALRWAKRIFVLPIGERFAIISLTAAFFSPRVTFTVLLTWGGLAAAYSLTGKVLRSVSR